MPNEKFVGVSCMKFENLKVVGIVSIDIKVLCQVIPFIMIQGCQRFDGNYWQYVQDRKCQDEDITANSKLLL